MYDAATRRSVPLKGMVGNGFKLVRWQGPTAFFGLAVDETGNTAGRGELQPEQPQLHHLRQDRSRRLAGLRERALTQGGATTVPCPPRLGAQRASWTSRPGNRHGRIPPTQEHTPWPPSTPSAPARSSTRAATPPSRSRCASTTAARPRGRPVRRVHRCVRGGRAARRRRALRRQGRREGGHRRHDQIGPSSSASTPASSGSSTRRCSTSTAPPTRPPSAPTRSSASPSPWPRPPPRAPGCRCSATSAAPTPTCCRCR